MSIFIFQKTAGTAVEEEEAVVATRVAEATKVEVADTAVEEVRSSYPRRISMF